MRTTRRATIEDLRTAVQALPRTTRLAMLDGLRDEQIIVGAYAHQDGICPMLAAHRRGSRTSTISFARAWDRFAYTGSRVTQPRPATAHELLVLQTHLETSLLDEEVPETNLAAAITEHQELMSRRRRDREAFLDRARRRSARRRPGDPDRSRELASQPGWAWTRLVRDYDEYQEAVQQVASKPASAAELSAL